jgi:hypothetical protein
MRRHARTQTSCRNNHYNLHKWAISIRGAHIGFKLADGIRKPLLPVSAAYRKFRPALHSNSDVHLNAKD